MAMLKTSLAVLFIFVFLSGGCIYKLSLRKNCLLCALNHLDKTSPVEYVLINGTSIVLSNGTSIVLSGANSIFFLETGDGLEPRPLVPCAVESAARIYPDRPVVFFMKGLVNHTVQETRTTHKAFNLLSTIDNVFMLPLNMDELFQDTPLLSWFLKVKPAQEKYWLQVSADAARLAAVWKYGGIYFDSDVFSIRPIQTVNFVASEGATTSGNAVFGFSARHEFTWECMVDFVEKYRGNVWGFQGPTLLTRILQKHCKLPVYKDRDDGMCHNISFLNPQRFYPIGWNSWKRYYEVWPVNPTFDDSYGLHLWNYMNQEGRAAIVGSKTLVEHLYKTYCPSTYELLIQKAKEE